MHLTRPTLTRSVLDVEVIEGSVPRPWSATTVVGPVCADPDRALLRFGDAAVYVANGAEVVLETAGPQSREENDFLVYSTAARLLLLQRRQFTLHATLVLSPSGRCVAISGESTAGKSTTTMALVQRGWEFICDDIVEVDENVTAIPFHRPLHLSDRAARLVGSDPSVGLAIADSDKRAYAFTADLTARPLDIMVRIRVDGDSVRASAVPPSEAFPITMADSDRYRIAHHPDLRNDYFAWGSRMAANVPLWTVTRPANGDSVNEVADAVERVVRLAL